MTDAFRRRSTSILTAAMRVAAFVVATMTAVAAAQKPAAPTPDIHYVPTSAGVADAMLKLARVTATDVVYDLGSGDGRIVIEAANSVREAWDRAGRRAYQAGHEERTEGGRCGQGHVSAGRLVQDQPVGRDGRDALSVEFDQHAAAVDPAAATQARLAGRLTPVRDGRLEAGSDRAARRHQRSPVDHSVTPIGHRAS